MEDCAKNADVLLLAAGFGKRLKERTHSTPKPLVKVAGVTLIDRNLSLIASAGFKRVLINLHYLPKQIRDHVGDGNRWGLKVIYKEENPILDTGGAIKNVEADMRTDQLIVINSDIVVSRKFNLPDLISGHLNCKFSPVATLVLKKHVEAQSFGEIGIDDKGQIEYFIDVEGGGVASQRGFIFMGIQIISRELIEDMPPAGRVFSITRDVYRDVVKKGERALGSFIFDGYWNDVGTPLRLKETEEYLMLNPEI